MVRRKKRSIISSSSEQEKSRGVLLYDEYRLVEREGTDIHRAWKGAHILLFFMAFICGSFCTFCLHMLMYMFDEQCVLFPKLLSLTAPQKKVSPSSTPGETEEDMSLPVDFVSTQWAEKSVCYWPTFVPLVSSIFGLVWITMFLMCWTGTKTYTGLERPWRILLPLFLFSLAMGSLSIYTSIFTHQGLYEFCDKLSVVTGATSCSYAINVVTLAYQRRITGVYQALQMTIISAWVHTACWILSASLVLVRVSLAVDFQLVRVKATLIGDVDLMLQRHERQIRTVSPDAGVKSETTTEQPDITIHYRRDHPPPSMDPRPHYNAHLYPQPMLEVKSELSLLPEEKARISKVTAINKIPRDKQFIVRMIYELVESLDLKESKVSLAKNKAKLTRTGLSGISFGDEPPIRRTYGQEKISLVSAPITPTNRSPAANQSVDSVMKDFLSAELFKHLKNHLSLNKDSMNIPSTSTATLNKAISTETDASDTKTLTPQPSTSKREAKEELNDTEKDDGLVEMLDRAVQTAPKETKVTFLEDKTTMTSDDQIVQTSPKPDDKDPKKKKKPKMD